MSAALSALGVPAEKTHPRRRRRAAARGGAGGARHAAARADGGRWRPAGRAPWRQRRGAAPPRMRSRLRPGNTSVSKTAKGLRLRGGSENRGEGVGGTRAVREGWRQSAYRACRCAQRRCHGIGGHGRHGDEIHGVGRLVGKPTGCPKRSVLGSRAVVDSYDKLHDRNF